MAVSLAGLGARLRARAREGVGRTLGAARADGVEGGAGEDRVAVDRDRDTELVERGPVRGGQLGGLGARRRARADERVGGALGAAGAERVEGRAGDDACRRRSRPRTRARRRGAVRGGQLGRLRARRRARTGEGVGRALLGVRADVVQEGAGDDRVAVDRDREPELVARGAVRGGQLGGLRARRRRSARTCRRSPARRWRRRRRGGAGDDRVAVDRDRDAELVACGAVGGGQLGGLGARPRPRGRTRRRSPGPRSRRCRRAGRRRRSCRRRSRPRYPSSSPAAPSAAVSLAVCRPAVARAPKDVDRASAAVVAGSAEDERVPVDRDRARRACPRGAVYGGQPAARAPPPAKRARARTAARAPRRGRTVWAQPGAFRRGQSRPVPRAPPGDGEWRRADSPWAGVAVTR